MDNIVARINKKNTKLKDLMASCDQLELNFKELCETNNIEVTPYNLNDKHIKNLKKYNELRDTGLRLVQFIANEKNCRIKEIFEEMNFSTED
ncbi:HCL394Wp [Eremothecium sinecaudum]|uniref:HCL394Wp n=1 Tax=Eremothecium sinecaudum TaxID=45286 RepID=A0A120K1V0_9SACH|nr:HCL394Wp [Eremothecium sinecaudum]AMD19757.1 HCL394Wp [Eremothecium sinecaudum]